MATNRAKAKAPAQLIASITRTKDATFQKEIESLQRQLAESKSRAAMLQATIKETRDTLAFTDLDCERIAAAMQQQQSRDQSTDRFLTTAFLKSTYQSLKQPDPPLLSDSKDLTYTSWNILVQAKLQDNNNHFPSENSKLTYVYKRTTGAAQAYLEPQFEYGTPNPFCTVDEVMAHLAAIYQNLMQQAIA
jgi:septal ring factor EnvC (AmiA/AmiB activator)